MILDVLKSFTFYHLNEFVQSSTAQCLANGKTTLVIAMSVLNPFGTVSLRASVGLDSEESG